jgi:hypothetical protein
MSLVCVGSSCYGLVNFMKLETSMRFITGLLFATILILSACNPGNKFEVIGKFDAMVGVRKMEFPSYRNTEKNRGGINFRYEGDTRTMIFDGLAGDFVNGQPDLPMLAVVFKSNLDGRNVELDSIKLHKVFTIKTVRHVFYRSNATTGSQTATNPVIDAQGNVSFEFSADLYRIDANTNKPVQDEAPLHVEGIFSGVIPEDQRHAPSIAHGSEF